MAKCYKREVQLKEQRQDIERGFRFGTTESRYFPKKLHKHPEMELLYINKGEGLCFAGDGITPFLPGELLFFSGYLAHYLKSAPQFYDPNYPLRCGTTYVQFSQNILPVDVTTMVECDNINNLIIAGQQGLKWSVKDLDSDTIHKIEMMEQQHGFDRMVTLYKVLDQLGKRIGDAIALASHYTINTTRRNNGSAYKIVVEHISHNFSDTIKLDDLAAEVEMNRSALCRHFIARAECSIFEFVLKYRISYARIRLISTELPIAEIAQESGFKNLPNFNVQFKRITGCTPSEYRIKNNRLKPII